MNLEQAIRKINSLYDNGEISEQARDDMQFNLIASIVEEADKL